MNTKFPMAKSMYTLLGVLLFPQCASLSDPLPYRTIKTPGERPIIFLPGMVSVKDRWEGNVSFDPDGKTFFFNVFQDSSKSIYRSIFENGQWSDPAPFLIPESKNHWEPFVSWDGNRLYFVSGNPPGSEEWNGRIWCLDKNKSGDWSAPKYIALPVDTKNGLWFPNTTKDGVLYFGGRNLTKDSIGKSDLYYAQLDDKEIKPIPDICSTEDDWDPFVAPDESYILWASDREGGYGGMDLYISFKQEDGTWGPTKNLGNTINTPDYEVAPRITLDGRFLFFDRPVNGTQDIFWVSTQILKSLKGL